MNVAFIPVRGGSKSIPLKNIKLICGKPLVYWSIKAACECKYIDKVFVATDSMLIHDTVEKMNCDKEVDFFRKLKVIGRSAESASDAASTEFTMLEFAEQYTFDNIVLIQATSPMLKATDLTGGFELFESPGTDSVLSVVRQYRFLWDLDSGGNAFPQNYDIFQRPRRQKFPGYLMENGAFYISSRKMLLESKNRISGNIKAYEMNEETSFEIDELSDWIIIEALMKKNGYAQNEIKKPIIKMFLTDCDGCLTDGGMYYSEKGDELKKFHTRDGMGISMLREKNIITGIITGEETQLVERRAHKLKVDEVHQGIKDKLSVVKQLAEKYNLSLKEIAYVGDDINDIEVMHEVGLPCTVWNAQEEVKLCAEYISPFSGGDGAIRDIIDKLLKENMD